MEPSRGPPATEPRPREPRRGCVPVTGAGEGEKLQSLRDLRAHATDASGPDATCQSGSRKNKDVASFPATEPITSVRTSACVPRLAEAPAWSSEASRGGKRLSGKCLCFFFRVSGTAGASSVSSAPAVVPAGTGPDSSLHAAASLAAAATRWAHSCGWSALCPRSSGVGGALPSCCVIFRSLPSVGLHHRTVDGPGTEGPPAELPLASSNPPLPPPTSSYFGQIRLTHFPPRTRNILLNKAFHG